jgi:uncharacterized protein with HEPN domain
MSSENPRKRFEDMLGQIERIESHIDGVDYEAFLENLLVYDAVERCLERICEAARKIGNGYDAMYPEVEFHRLRDFGSKLRHDYDAILSDRVWTAVKERLPLLKAACRAELGS